MVRIGWGRKSFVAFHTLSWWLGGLSFGWACHHWESCHRWVGINLLVQCNRLIFSVSAYFLDVHPKVQHATHGITSCMCTCQCGNTLQNPECTSQSTKAWDSQVLFWNIKGASVRSNIDQLYFPPTIVIDHYQTVTKHRTWAENGFSQQAIAFVQLTLGFH